MVDFTKLSRPSRARRSIDPIELFERRPSHPQTPNDIWRGQTEALRSWHANRQASDALILLNTGAGKTIIGLLIAQSILNEGVENVVYLCSTIDLVFQTLKEADKLGIKCTARIRGDFDNDLFEQGRAFCVTTYSSVINSRSVIQRKYPPGAVIFDDAHVAEKIIRDAFTITIPQMEFGQLYTEIGHLFMPDFEQMGRRGTFREVLGGSVPQIYLAPPSALLAKHAQLDMLLRRHAVHEHDQLKYSYAYLEDNLAHCAMLFGNGTIEIGPPFLPTLAMPLFGPGIRRIYLSATLTSRADLVRAFGRMPNIVIEPKNDAGNGERLVLFAGGLPKSEVDEEFVADLAKRHKIVVAVPTYARAERWRAAAVIPKTDEFSARLDEFRKSDKGVFVLVARVDGIDLPHDTCRVMVIDQLPAGATILERYQLQMLGMRDAYAAKIANRVVQLFGRINWGRNDYGVFLVSGRDTIAWLLNERNQALLPDLLGRQVRLGQHLFESTIRKLEDLQQVIDDVLNRKEEWIDYYQDSMEEMKLDADVVESASEAEGVLTQAALAEAEFMRRIWNREYARGRRELEARTESVSRADPKLAGWHNIWIGMCLEAEGDRRAALREYERARARLGQQVILPIDLELERTHTAEPVASVFFSRIDKIVGQESEDAYQRERRLASRRMEALDRRDAKSGEHEEAIRCLGELLGKAASRPDKEVGTGPDVLWIDEDEGTSVSFECKTNKKDPAVYYKKDIARAHDHIEWVRQNYSELDHLGLLFVGPAGECDDAANPSDEMYHGELMTFREMRDELIAAVTDFRVRPPLLRRAQVAKFAQEGRFALTELFRRLAARKLQDL